ncbi:hypothetical protein EAE91_23135 [Photorhabdus noenieputensis]|uniref:DUF5625 family protein n=1 Tax=Photorhabdus noenieputensis TaxID=1208607 RepID=UPI001BD577D9|nr:DUF5625 family protein [Photorhabdus noenieputensis]MBS9439934.1 hypothetical protein [Photorhabdus noenieputensis]MCK3668208.1 DUF5625 family protein [Photorhabdus noenieputensis]
MKVLRVHERFKSWRNIIVFMSFTLLMACSKHIDTIRKPIDVSHSDQSVEINFELSKSKAGDYQFALLFAKGNGYQEILRRLELFGSIDKVGVITPVSFRLVKDGKVFFDEEINAVGSEGTQSFYYKERNIATAVREIKTLSLPSGRYSAVITTLEDVPDFNGIQSFIQLTYFNPKI